MKVSSSCDLHPYKFRYVPIVTYGCLNEITLISSINENLKFQLNASVWIEYTVQPEILTYAGKSNRRILNLAVQVHTAKPPNLIPRQILWLYGTHLGPYFNLHRSDRLSPKPEISWNVGGHHLLYIFNCKGDISFRLFLFYRRVIHLQSVT